VPTEVAQKIARALRRRRVEDLLRRSLLDDTPGVEDGHPVADATRALGVRVLPLEVRAPADYDSVFAPLAAKPIDGLVMFTDPLTWANWKRVADFAFTNRVPTVCEFRQLAESGCLVSYGPTFDEFGRRVASQVDRILKGNRAADVPYEQVTRFELVINLRTARALSIKISRSVLVRANEVIE
jgi:putative tryptophan/tyrosine transport system substrate-binding protein